MIITTASWEIETGKGEEHMGTKLHINVKKKSMIIVYINCFSTPKFYR